jgi:hypothetical protein
MEKSIEIEYDYIDPESWKKLINLMDSLPVFEEVDDVEIGFLF